MSDEKKFTRREILLAGGASAAAAITTGVVMSGRGTAPKVGNETAVPAAVEPIAPVVGDLSSGVVDVRKDALLVPKSPVKDIDYSLFAFETQKLPDVQKVELKLHAAQVYQLATIGDSKTGALEAIVLPKQDGKVKILELRPGQEVQLQVFMNKDAEASPVLETGRALGKNWKQGEKPGWVKPITDALEKDDATKGARNNLVAPFYKELVAQFDESKKQNKLSGGFKDKGLYLDTHIQAQITAKVEK